MMKKNLVVPMLLGSLLAAMVMTGCLSSMTKVWDETLPESETTKIWFYYDAKVVTYNGVALEKGYSFFQIPSGNATFTIDMSYVLGNVTFKANGLEFDYFFEAEKEYSVITRRIFNEEDKSEVWGVNIYDEIPRISFPGKEHFLEFVPFKIQPKF